MADKYDKKEVPVDEHFFCQEVKDERTGNVYFFDFYKHPGLVKMCGAKLEDVIEVVVNLAAEGDNSPYFAWHCYADGGFNFIWPSRGQVAMCFPYGPETEENLGRGKLVNVTVRKI